MYSEIQQIIEARFFSEVSELVTVGTALRDKQPKRPDALVWLAEDKDVGGNPTVLRELVWMVKLSVDHEKVDGLAQTKMHEILNDARIAFAGWRPAGVVGIRGAMQVGTIRISDHKELGPTEYLMQIIHRVFPKNFSIN